MFSFIDIMKEENTRPHLKTPTSHRVLPLFPELRALLVPWIGDRCGLLFPSPSGRMYRDVRGLLVGALKEADITTPITVHGLRHSLATHLREDLAIPPDVVSLILGHAVQGPAVSRIYDRAQRLGERRRALEAWAAWLERLQRAPEDRGRMLRFPG